MSRNRSVLFGLIFFCRALFAGSYELVPILDGFRSPVHVTNAGDSYLYVVEQAGKIKKIDPYGAVSTFLDIQSQVTSGGETGLLSVAFHPQYATNHRYFVNYTANVSGALHTIIAEINSETHAQREILRIRQPYSNHNGGQIAFGPDGYLYIGMGDGGSAGDPQNNSQNKQSLLGKMLRIDVNGAEPYAIPPTNPFALNGGRAEISAWGLRNPWRFSFDSETGALYAGDVGQGAREEIDIIEIGKNYGWRVMEGTLCFNPLFNCNKTDLTMPIYEYPRSEGYSITGGFIYRGPLLASLQGQYIYADYGSTKVWALKYDPQTGEATNTLLAQTGVPISSFGEDANRELLVVGHTGTIYQFYEMER